MKRLLLAVAMIMIMVGCVPIPSSAGILDVFTLDSEKIILDLHIDPVGKFTDLKNVSKLGKWNADLQWKASLIDSSLATVGFNFESSYHRADEASTIPFSVGLYARPFGISWLEPYADYYNTANVKSFALDESDEFVAGFRIKIVDK